MVAQQLISFSSALQSLVGCTVLAGFVSLFSGATSARCLFIYFYISYLFNMSGICLNRALQEKIRRRQAESDLDPTSFSLKCPHWGIFSSLASDLLNRNDMVAKPEEKTCLLALMNCHHLSARARIVTQRQGKDWQWEQSISGFQFVLC